MPMNAKEHHHMHHRQAIQHIINAQTAISACGWNLDQSTGRIYDTKTPLYQYIDDTLRDTWEILNQLEISLVKVDSSSYRAVNKNIQAKTLIAMEHLKFIIGIQIALEKGTSLSKNDLQEIWNDLNSIICQDPETYPDNFTDANGFLEYAANQLREYVKEDTNA